MGEPDPPAAPYERGFLTDLRCELDRAIRDLKQGRPGVCEHRLERLDRDLRRQEQWEQR